MAFADLHRRALTGFPLAGGFIALIVLANFTCTGNFILMGLGLLVVAVCVWEFALLCNVERKQHPTPSSSQERWIAAPLTALGLLVPALLQIRGALPLLDPMTRSCGTAAVSGYLVEGVVVSLLFISAAAGVLGRVSREAVTRHFSMTFPAFILIAVGGSALSALAVSEGTPWSLLWLAFVVCLNDIAAYFAGSILKGPKFSPHLSPAKSLSGSAGGLLAGVLTGLVVSSLLPGSRDALYVVEMSAAVVVAAQAGDLLKSYLKRIAGVKDTGTLLPGHGGILDRLDGMLAGAPIVLLWWVP